MLETPGEVKIAFGGREFFVSPIGFVVGVGVAGAAALVLLKILGFLAALMRFLLGDETAISRYFSRSRERRGLRRAVATAWWRSPPATRRRRSKKAPRPRSCCTAPT